MADALKDRYLSTDFFQQFATDLKLAYPALDKRAFYRDCISPLDELELMQRVSHLTRTVASHLPNSYKKALSVLYDLSPILGDKLGYLFMSEFVATYGLDEYELSINALRNFTHHSSSEFAIRVFLQQDFKRTIKHMTEWTEHESEHVRRLASEGSRPRLPWAQKLDQVINKPSLTWPILNRLKNDSSNYVQKSVANHLNDISKDNPDWMIKKVSAWSQKNTTTKWIIKHGCRTLIKKGHADSLHLLGYSKPNIKISPLKLSAKIIRLGETLEVGFNIKNMDNKPQKLVVDYCIDFVKKDGSLRPKVFKLKTLSVKTNEQLAVNKKHAFKAMTTRKFYPGKHRLQIIINGERFNHCSFDLKLD